MSIVSKRVKQPIGRCVLDLLAQRECFYGFRALYEAIQQRRPSTSYKSAHKALRGLMRKGYARKDPTCRILATDLGREVNRQMARDPGNRLLVRSHNLVFKCHIVRKPEQAFEDGWFSVNPGARNWKQYYRHTSDNVFVHISPRTVCINVKEVVAEDVDVAVMSAFYEVLRILIFLHSRYPGLQIGYPENVCANIKQHHAIHSKPVQEFLGEYRIKYKDERVHIDYSTGKLPEIEFVHPVHAQGDMREFVDFAKAVVNGEFNWREIANAYRDISKKS